MVELIGVVVIAIGYASGYIVSLYASAVYIDPDEIESLLPSASASNRAFLLRLAGDPRALVQVAEVYKSMWLLVITVVSVKLITAVSSASGLSLYLAYPIGLAVIWILYMLFVEVMPRMSSRRAINEGMLRHLWVIRVVHRLFFPVVLLYRRAVKRSKPEEPVTEEEKEEIVERAIEAVADHAGISQTIVDEEEKAMISQIFLLDQTVVREIMIPRMDIVGIEREMSFKSIRELVRRDGHSRYPVYEESIDKIIGLLYVKDLFSKPPERGEKFVIDDYLRKPYFVPETKVIGELLREFKDKRQHIALVADEYGGLAGLVTLEDIIEEIFGEIQDEHDAEVAEYLELGDGQYIVSASLMVEKLQDYLDTDYEQGDYDTVGGLIYDLVGSVPTQGQKIQWNDLEFEVGKVEGQRILRVKVRKKLRSQ
ncbi:MAG: HlyC/CorC family transporter [Candidatus Zixiibacteriota bacterium]|nr:MAG: HlyC/CorC family transporter [candidate division Zixibacteria bacterium]